MSTGLPSCGARQGAACGAEPRPCLSRWEGGQEEGDAGPGGGGGEVWRPVGHGAVLAWRGAAAGRVRGGRCWRGLCQSRCRLTPRPCPQVQRFLEMSGQAPDVVEGYCALYRRLRGATEELFGQQAAFVAALGQGFAGALLQLSFLTALHVSPGAQRGPCPCPCLPGALPHARPLLRGPGLLPVPRPRCGRPVPTQPSPSLRR